MKKHTPLWLQKLLLALGRSLRLRLVLVFLLLALAVAATFITGAQKAFSIGWREAARPLLADYVDRLHAEITQTPGGVPSVEKALALTQRLPITVAITGPQTNWQSHPDDEHDHWHRDRYGDEREQREKDWKPLLQRTSADGHTVTFGINKDSFERRPRLIVYALGILFLLTLLAYLYVRRLLRPLDSIRAGAQRFGAGNFDQKIPVRHPTRPDELGELAQAINTMGQDIHQMLEAKRSLLLAISHELRSPLTRARLNTELLPETAEVASSREALLQDLALMRDLVTDLLESERLSSGHHALNREPTDLKQLASEVIASLPAASAGPAVSLKLADGLSSLPLPQLDRTRMRLLLRNLMDNALRHSAGASQPPCLEISYLGGAQDKPVLQITLRDFGSGVSEEALPQLAQAFYRPDTARTRGDGGVGLGLYLCKLVVLAHGGSFELRNAQPGLEVLVTLPALQA